MEAAGTSVTLLPQPVDERLNVFPILTSLLKVIENTSSGFIDLAQDETLCTRTLEGKSYLNDHLLQEFKIRLAKNGKSYFTVDFPTC